MTRAVYALSLILVLVGAVAVAAGIPLIYIEQGWTEVICGTIAVAAGCVVFVLGACLSRMEGLRVAIERLSALGLPLTPAVVPDLPSIPADVAPEPQSAPAERTVPGVERKVDDDADDVRPEPALAVFEERTPEPVPEEAVVLPPPEPAGPVPVSTPEPGFAPTASEVPAEAAWKRPSFLSSLRAKRERDGAAGERSRPREPLEPVFGSALVPAQALRHPEPSLSESTDQTGTDAAFVGELAASETVRPVQVEAMHPVVPEPQILPPEPVAPEYLPSEPEPAEEPEPEPVSEPEATAPSAASVEHPLRAPTVVGRYNAGSASYIMYSNGMIEVETETGVHQFESMQELKSFIENQEAARV